MNKLWLTISALLILAVIVVLALKPHSDYVNSNHKTRYVPHTYNRVPVYHERGWHKGVIPPMIKGESSPMPSHTR